ncbi:hypothetical protein ACFOEX_08175, partial [Camelimonas abortus]
MERERKAELQALAEQVNAALAAAQADDDARRARDESPEALGHAVREAAHVYNNLLAVLQGTVELLRHPALPEARRARYLQALEASTSRAAEETRRIQALGRRLAPRRVVLDLAPVVSAAARRHGLALAAPA